MKAKFLYEVKAIVFAAHRDMAISRLGYVTRIYFYALCEALAKRFETKTFEELSKDCPVRYWNNHIACCGLQRGGLQFDCSEKNCAMYHFYKMGA